MKTKRKFTLNEDLRHMFGCGSRKANTIINGSHKVFRKENMGDCKIGPQMRKHTNLKCP